MSKKIFITLLFASFAYFSHGKVFVPSNGGFIEKTVNIEKKSINNIVGYLGYNSDQYYSYFDLESTDKDIFTITFKVFTDKIICVITNDSVKNLSTERVKNYLSKYDFKNEFSAYDVDRTLNDGIKNKSLTAKFLAEVLNVEASELNGTMYAPSIGYKIEFSQGIIKKFYSSDGLNKWAKEWKSEQPDLYKSYENAAKKYWGNNIEKVINEINVQADAWANTHEGYQNEYLKYHRTAEGTINFKMLLVAHYNEPMTLTEFKEINYGRYQLTDEFNTSDGYKRTTYKLNKTLYTFSGDGKLINSYTSE